MSLIYPCSEKIIVLGKFEDDVLKVWQNPLSKIRPSLTTSDDGLRIQNIISETTKIYAIKLSHSCLTYSINLLNHSSPQMFSRKASSLLRKG
jgi:hypothetical protein